MNKQLLPRKKIYKKFFLLRNNQILAEVEDIRIGGEVQMLKIWILFMSRFHFTLGLE